MAQMKKTVRGFSPWEVVSALQKSIRRGDQVQAVAWAVELDQSGHGTWLWNRLLVITSEDVGLGWPEGPAVIRGLFDTWREQKAYNRDSHPERLMVVHAALLLARAPKSRLVDEATCGTYGVEEPLVKEIPDYAFDMHTAKGKRLGRGLEHWEQEASHLENPADIDPPIDWWAREKAHFGSDFAAQQGAARRTPPQYVCSECGAMDSQADPGLF